MCHLIQQEFNYAKEHPKIQIKEKYIQKWHKIFYVKWKSSCIYRIDVNFKMEKKNIDTIIGRAAHIQFLENQVVMKMLIYRYPHFFGW